MMFPSVVLTHLKGTMRAALRPEPVRVARWSWPAWPRAVQRARPSVMTLASGVSQRFAPRAISRLRKLLTGTSLALRGRALGAGRDRSHERRLAGRARPRLPPERTPPNRPRHRLPGPQTASRFHRRDAILPCRKAMPFFRVGKQCPRWPQPGQTKPSPQRSRASVLRYCSSVPNASRNAASLRPRTRDATLNPIAVTSVKKIFACQEDFCLAASFVIR